VPKPNPRSEAIRQTLAFYDQHAEDFIERTAKVSMAQLYEPFLALIRLEGHILDAACGSGRDAAEFARRGYHVTAFDGSGKMARLASSRTGLNVLHLRFDEIGWQEEFDGIWASASLLHLPSAQLDEAMGRMVRALRTGGVLYVSIKLGEFAGMRDARWFTDTQPSTVRQLLASSGLDVIRIWQTDDIRPDRVRRAG
jgi:SAM-dependent methyltransferase